jgi:hypothetical protein
LYPGFTIIDPHPGLMVDIIAEFCERQFIEVTGNQGVGAFILGGIAKKQKVYEQQQFHYFT